MEPRRNSPHATPPGRGAYASPARTARVTSNTPGRVDGAPPRPPSGGEGARKQDGNGVTLPLITPPGHGPSMRGSSPGSSKRLGWTTPRSPTEESLEVRPPSSTTHRPARYEPTHELDHDVRFWNDGTPALPLGMPDDDSGDVREPDPTDVNQAAQLAYMEQMYTTIQQSNAELDRERADAKRRAASIESHVENREHATLDVLHGIGAEVEESENFGVVGAQIPIGGAGVSSAATVNKRFRPHQPRPTALPDPKAALAKEQLELCAALGKNAELRIRNREIEKQSESSSQVLEQTQRQMKMAERRIANREEKLRGLLKEKLHWQNEMKDLREQVVEEKMRQVDLLRRLETTKREAIAQVDAMAQMLRDVEEENQALRVHLVETKNQLASQTKKLEDVVRQSRDEKEKLVECINEARSKFKEWKDGEANVLRAQKDQAVNNLKAEYELKIARHQEEKQKLRDKVKDLEVSVRLMQKDRSLSPLELSLRKAAILGGRDSAGTTEGEVIEANVRIKELEAMLEHTAEYQKRQENIIKVSQATISRLLQEREVAALDGLASQPLLGSNGLVNSSAAPPDSSYFPFGAVSPVRGTFGCSSTLSPRQLHTVTRPPPRPPQVASEQPVVRPVAPPPRVAAPPVRRNSGDRVTKVTAKETEESLRQVDAEPKQAGPSPRELLLVQEVDRLQKGLAEAKEAFLREEKIRRQDAANVSRTDNSSTDQIPGPDNCETGTDISIFGPDGGDQSRADFTDIPDNGVAACHAPEVLEAVPVIGSPQPLVGDPNTLSSEYAQYIPTQASNDKLSPPPASEPNEADVEISALPSVERCNGDGDHDTPEHVALTEDCDVLPEDRMDRNTADAGLPSLGEAREEEASHDDVLSNGAPSDANTTINDTDPASGVDSIHESSQDVLEKDATCACTRNGEHKNGTLSEACTYDGHSSSQSIEPPTEPATHLGEQEKSNREAVSLVAEHFVQDVVMTHAIPSVASLVMECTTPIEASCVGRRPSFDSHRDAQLTEEVAEEIASVLVAQITDTELEASSLSNPDLRDSSPTHRDSVSEEGGPSNTATTELGICGTRVGDVEVGSESVQREPADMSNVADSVPTETASLVDDSDVVGLPEPSNESKVLIEATQIAMASFVSVATAQAAGVVIAMSSYSKPVMPAGNEGEPIMLRDHDHVCDHAPLAAETVCEARQTTDMSELLAARTFVNAITQHALDTLIAVAATKVHSEPQAQVSDTQMSSVSRAEARIEATEATSQPFEVAESATSAESKVDAIAVDEAVMEPGAKEIVGATVKVPADAFTEAEVNAAVEEAVEVPVETVLVAPIDAAVKEDVDTTEPETDVSLEEMSVESPVDLPVEARIGTLVIVADTPVSTSTDTRFEAKVEMVAEALVGVGVGEEASVEVSVEAPAEVPVDASVETADDASVEAAVEALVEAVLEAPPETSVEGSVELLVEASVVALIEATVEVPMEASVPKSTEATAEAAVETTVAKGHALVDVLVKTAVEETVAVLVETCEEEATAEVELIVETPAQESADAPVEVVAANSPVEAVVEVDAQPSVDVSVQTQVDVPIKGAEEAAIETLVDMAKVETDALVEVSVKESVETLVDAAVVAMMAEAESRMETVVDALQGVDIPVAEGETTVEASVDGFVAQPIHAPIAGAETPAEILVAEALEVAVDAVVGSSVEAAVDIPVQAPVETSIEAPVGAHVELPEQCAAEATIEAAVDTPMVEAIPMETPVNAALDTLAETLALGYVKAALESSVDAVVRTAVVSPVEAPEDAPVGVTTESAVETTLIDEQMPATATPLVEMSEEAFEKARFEAHAEAAAEVPAELSVKANDAEAAACAEDQVTEAVDPPEEASLITPEETAMGSLETTVPEADVSVEAVAADVEMSDEAHGGAGAEPAAVNLPPEGPAEPVSAPEEVTSESTIRAPVELSDEVKVVNSDIPAEVSIRTAVEVGEVLAGSIVEVSFVEAPVGVPVDELVEAAVEALVTKVELSVDTSVAVETLDKEEVEVPLVEENTPVDMPVEALVDSVVETLVDAPGDAAIESSVDSASDAPFDAKVAEVEMPVEKTVAESVESPMTEVDALVEAPEGGAVDIALVEVEESIESSVEVPVEPAVEATRVEAELPVEESVEASLVAIVETVVTEGEKREVSVEAGIEGTVVDTSVETSIGATINEPFEAAIDAPVIATVESLLVEVEKYVDTQEVAPTGEVGETEPFEEALVEAAVEHSFEASTDTPFESTVDSPPSEDVSADTAVESPVEVGAEAAEEVAVDAPAEVAVDGAGDTMETAVDVVAEAPVEATVDTAVDATIDAAMDTAVAAVVEAAVESSLVEVTGEAKVEVPAGAPNEVVVEDPPELAEEVKTAAEAPVKISAEAEPAVEIASFGNVASGETAVETQAEAHVEASVVAAIETALADEDASVEMPVEVSVDGPVGELAEDAMGSSTTVSKEVQLETPIEAPSAETMIALEEHANAPLESLTERPAVATDTHVEAAVCAAVEALVEASIAGPAVPLAVETETLMNRPVDEAVSTLLDESKGPVETKSPVDAPVQASVEALVEMVVAKAERSVESPAGAGVEFLVEVATMASVETPVQTPVEVFADASVAVEVILAPEVEAAAVAAADAREGAVTAPVDVSASNGERAAVEKAVDAARLSIEAVEAEIVENVSASVEGVIEAVVSESVDLAVESLVSSGSGVLSGETAVGRNDAVVEAVDEPTVMVCREPSILDMRFDSAGFRPPSARPSSSCSTRTDSYDGDIAPLNLNPDLWPELDLTLSAPAPTPDPSRYASGLIREMIRDPTLMAYDVKHEQERPFELMDEKILRIDQQARHMHFDENDRVRGSDPNVSPPPGTPSTEDGVLVTKKKRTGYDEKRKSIAYRLIPAFNYEPVLFKFQWSDFVVATPIRNLSSASQLDLLVKTGDAEGAANTADNPAKVTALLTCPVQKMTLLLKKGIRLPCGTYVIVSVFKRPLEDGNENLRVLIYDSERVEEFQYDFHEEHLRDYMEEWHATPDEARAFMARLEFRREQGMVIIKMPERIRESSVIYIDDRPSSSSSNTTNPLTYFQIHQYPPPLIPKFSLDSLIHATELPPEPQYRISPNAPILPPGTRRTPVDESTSENA